MNYGIRIKNPLTLLPPKAYTGPIPKWDTGLPADAETQPKWQKNYQSKMAMAIAPGEKDLKPW